MKKYLFSILLKQKVKKVQKVSRINKKNFVYFCDTNKASFVIKIYRNRYNPTSRFNNEVFWLKQFQEERFFKVPKIYLLKKFFRWHILVIYWIDGISMKKLIENSDNDLWINKLVKCISVLEKIWSYKATFNIDIDDSFEYKCGKHIDEIIGKLQQKRKKIIYCYDELLNIYNVLEKDIRIKKVLINSDISLHEFLFENNTITMLDYEYFCYGDINNDLAGIFYSASSSFIDNENERILKDIYNIISINKAFNLNNFLLYLIQRIVLADFFAGKTITNSEIIKYYQIVVRLYKEGNI